MSGMFFGTQCIAETGCTQCRYVPSQCTRRPTRTKLPGLLLYTVQYIHAIKSVCMRCHNFSAERRLRMINA